MSVDVYYFIEFKDQDTGRWRCAAREQHASLALRDALRNYASGEIQSNDFSLKNHPDLSQEALEAMNQRQVEINHFYSSAAEPHPVIWSYVDSNDISNYVESKVDEWFKRVDNQADAMQNREIINRLDMLERLIRNPKAPKPKPSEDDEHRYYYKSISDNDSLCDDLWDIMWLFAEYQTIRSLAREAADKTRWDKIDVRIVYHVA